MEIETARNLKKNWIINLTILECKFLVIFPIMPSAFNNKSNHIGM